MCKGDNAMVFYNKYGLPPATTFIAQTATLILEYVTSELAGDYSCFVTSRGINKDHYVATAPFIILGKSILGA